MEVDNKNDTGCDSNYYQEPENDPENPNNFD